MVGGEIEVQLAAGQRDRADGFTIDVRSGRVGVSEGSAVGSDGGGVGHATRTGFRCRVGEGEAAAIEGEAAGSGESTGSPAEVERACIDGGGAGVSVGGGEDQRASIDGGGAGVGVGGGEGHGRAAVFDQAAAADL